MCEANYITHVLAIIHRARGIDAEEIDNANLLKGLHTQFNSDFTSFYKRYYERAFAYSLACSQHASYRVALDTLLWTNEHEAQILDAVMDPSLAEQELIAILSTVASSVFTTTRLLLALELLHHPDHLSEFEVLVFYSICSRCAFATSLDFFRFQTGSC